jgi:serine/threonine protein kinase
VIGIYHLQVRTLEPGQIVGEYQVIKPLGRGGLGAVYRAVHMISQRQEAMKVLLADHTETAETVERFRREIQLLASLNHPNIAALHNAFHYEDQLIMIMELVEGEDLRSHSARTRIAMPQLIDFASQVLSALEYAHSRGIVHRDIKPANIMVSSSGPVKVLDFGIAITERSPELTAAGSIIGSPTHMAPEQIRGEKATPQSDIYSLGVTLYELIAGEPPIQGATSFELMMAHINHVPMALHVRRPEIPVFLSNAIATALEKNPAQRFASAAAFGTVLRAASMPVTRETAAMPAPATWQRISSGEINRPVTSSMPTSAVTLPTEAVIKHLAGFIGPIAKIVVPKLAREAADLDQLYAAASKQIDSGPERARFLRTRPR